MSRTTAGSHSGRPSGDALAALAEAPYDVLVCALLVLAVARLREPT